MEVLFVTIAAICGLIIGVKGAGALTYFIYSIPLYIPVIGLIVSLLVLYICKISKIKDGSW